MNASWSCIHFSISPPPSWITSRNHCSPFLACVCQGCMGFYMEFLCRTGFIDNFSNTIIQSNEAWCPEDVTGNSYLSLGFTLLQRRSSVWNSTGTVEHQKTIDEWAQCKATETLQWNIKSAKPQQEIIARAYFEHSYLIHHHSMSFGLNQFLSVKWGFTMLLHNCSGSPTYVSRIIKIMCLECFKMMKHWGKTDQMFAKTL